MNQLLVLYFLPMLCYQPVFSLTKDELLTKATELEAKLQKIVDELRETHPIVTKIIEAEVKELGLLATEIKQAEQVVNSLELRLNSIETRVNEQIQIIQDGINPTTLQLSSNITSSTVSTAPTLLTTTVPINCQTESLNKLSSLVKKLDAQIDMLSDQHKEAEAIVLTDKLKQVLVWEGQLDNLLKQVNSIIVLADNLDKLLKIDALELTFLRESLFK